MKSLRSRPVSVLPCLRRIVDSYCKATAVRPIDAPFSVEGWGTSLVADFYGIGTGDSCDLDAVRDTFSDVIPKDVVAIGSDPGGNQVCLRLSSGRVGEVLFLDHEDLKRRLRVIAGDFSTFLSDLKPDDYFD